jgi:hypothetical protein
MWGPGAVPPKFVIRDAMTACRLDEGILLECSGTLLPWGTPRAEWEHLAGCVVTQRPTSIHYEWADRTCLAGLPCDVHASRFLGAPNPRAYHPYLDHFHSAGLTIRRPRVEPASVGEDFRRLLTHLEGLFGPVQFSYPRYSRGLPGVFWQAPRLLIGFCVLGGALYHAFVQHEPDGYKELRDEARFIRAREGEGARVEGIAW